MLLAFREKKNINIKNAVVQMQNTKQKNLKKKKRKKL